jgi:hypothetical protein
VEERQAEADKDKALKFAQMANLKTLKAVHIPSPKMREFGTLVKHRKSLDQRGNRLKNSIRSLFVNHGIQINEGATLDPQVTDLPRHDTIWFGPLYTPKCRMLRSLSVVRVTPSLYAPHS